MKTFEMSAYGVEEMSNEDIVNVNGGGFWDTLNKISWWCNNLDLVIAITVVVPFVEGFEEGFNDYQNIKK